MKNQRDRAAKSAPANPREAKATPYASPRIKTHSADRLRQALLSVNAATNLNPNP